MKKGFIFILEMIIALIILFVAFNIFFPGFSYNSKWSDAFVISLARDSIITADRIGKSYEFSFNSSFANQFLYGSNIISPATLAWTGTDGTIKSEITIACNCTGDDINNLTSWFKGLRINGREIGVNVIYTNLNSINPSDVLFIWGYKDLTSYVDPIKNYLKLGNGVVELSDIYNLDEGHKKIFGLEEANGNIDEISVYDEFRRNPDNSNDVIYTPWKYFYHIPVPLFATQTAGSIPSDIVTQSCTNISTGSFNIQSNITGGNQGDVIKYTFWICDSKYVYFDTNLNGRADIELKEGDDFSIQNYYDSTKNWVFHLNYIDVQERIGVSFSPGYDFHDFIKYEFGCDADSHPGHPNRDSKPIPPGWCQGNKPWASYNLLTTAPEDYNKILIQADIKTDQNEPIPGVILNTSISRVSWISNFTEEGTGDDERLLLISMLLWASNKKSVEVPQSLRKVYIIPYINVNNKDMYESYVTNLGLGYPY